MAKKSPKPQPLTDDQAKALLAMPFLAVDDPRKALHFGPRDNDLATVHVLLSAGLAALNGRVVVVTPDGERALIRYRALKDNWIDRAPRNIHSAC